METTEKVLNLLQQNARLSSAAIAEMLAVSEQEVDAIIKKNEDEMVGIT